MLIISDYPPTPQGRPRVTKFVTYDPTAPQKKQFLKSIINQLPKKPLTKPIALRLLFKIKRPKSHYNSKGELKPTASFLPDKRPDLDNYIKFVLDALNGILYKDDAQIVIIFAKKKYADHSGIEIRIKELHKNSDCISNR